MENLCKKLMLGGSVAAMLAAVSAVADAQENATPESVTVSASRISIQGYEAPTPVTVIGVEQLERDAKVDIGDAIRELPSVGISDSPGNGSHAGNASQGDAGLDTVNLRNLGVVRTLVLFDGQRVATSNPNASAPPAIGGVDLSTIPTSIIERVDVVTGGASAAWGSDAVAGVVNLVINKHFSGFKANIVYGNSSADDHQSTKVELTAGTDFLGGRGHIEFAGNYTMSPNTFFSWNRPWYRNTALYPCASVGRTGPTLCHVNDSYPATFTNGGLITASPSSTGFISGVTGGSAANTPQQNLAGNIAFINSLGQGYTGVGATPGTANQLRGNQFVGANAQAVPFNFGILAPGGANCIQCSANVFSDITNPPLIGVPYHSLVLFNYTSFRITDDISASVMLNYGTNSEQNQANNGRQSQQTIGIDNPFLPASIRQQMIAGGIPSITLGTAANQNLTVADVTNGKSLKAYEKAIGQNYIQNYRQLMRGVFTLTGGLHLFGEEWSWNAYAQNTSVRERQYAPYNTYNQNFSNAVDAVTVTATGRDSLGGGNPILAGQVAAALNKAGVKLPLPGDVACRSALTATSFGTTTNAAGFQVIQPGGLMPGCVPLNLFGEGTVSQAALNYIAPGRLNKGISDQALYLIGQSVFSVSTQGTLPFGLEAGKVAVAFGFEDRLEQQRITRDPLQLGASGVFESGNFAQYAGQYNVQEGFLELNVPVLKNNIVDTLDFNAAGRITSYSTSGLVETWKLGMTSQINEDIKLRATLSSDIRAPGIGELFSNPLISTQTIAYPPGGPTFNVHFGAAGNSALVPEQAETVSGGIVLTPHWIENLSLSFDWYSITLHNGIFAPSAGQIFDQCANKKVANFCSLVFFGRGYPGNGTLPVGSEVDGNGVSPGLSGPLGTFSADSEGAFNFYLQSPVNANRETVSGLDFQADYHHELFDGNLAWHLLGNYTDQKTRTSLGVTFDGAGAVSGDGAVNPLTGFTSPKFRGTISSTYAENDWTVTAQARVIGSAVLSNLYNEGIDVDNNGIPAVIYGDFRASYRFSDRIQLYGAVDNMFNAPPPIIASTGGGVTDCRIYDCIGRQYRIGVRFDD
ncbi:MAG: TonB-dependent receptor [Alphaproteobacteria bacterium]|nr:TonB-dependent receptor [Alphaproteobacteria bacterium]